MDAKSLRALYEDELSKILQEEIDWEILSSSLTESGYIAITLEKNYDPVVKLEIRSWLENTCKSHFYQRDRYYLFQKAEDAEWFTLRWS